MMYISRMVHKINGDILRYFGTKSQCEFYIKSISSDYVSEVRLASVAELRSQILVVKDRREKIKFNYSFAPPLKRGQYRASLQRANGELKRLHNAIREIVEFQEFQTLQEGVDKNRAA